MPGSDQARTGSTVLWASTSHLFPRPRQGQAQQTQAGRTGAADTDVEEARTGDDCAAGQYVSASASDQASDCVTVTAVWPLMWTRRWTGCFTECTSQTRSSAWPVRTVASEPCVQCATRSEVDASEAERTVCANGRFSSDVSECELRKTQTPRLLLSPSPSSPSSSSYEAARQTQTSRLLLSPSPSSPISSSYEAAPRSAKPPML